MVFGSLASRINLLHACARRAFAVICLVALADGTGATIQLHLQGISTANEGDIRTVTYGVYAIYGGGHLASSSYSLSAPGALVVGGSLSGSVNDGQTSDLTQAMLQYADEGTYSLSASGQFIQKDSSNNTIATSNLSILGTQTVTIKNVAPTINSVSGAGQYGFNEEFTFSASATDPGLNDTIGYNWDLDGDGQYDDFSGAGGSHSFAEAGTYTIGVEAFDNDGGVSTPSLFTVEVAPPEPSILALKGVFGPGATGDPLGGLNRPRGIAVAPTGEVYVTDSRNTRIVQYSSDGDFLSAFLTGEPASEDNDFVADSQPNSVTINPTDGKLYVTDRDRDQVRVFTTEGVESPFTPDPSFTSPSLSGAQLRGLTIQGDRAFVVARDYHSVLEYDLTKDDPDSPGAETSYGDSIPNSGDGPSDFHDPLGIDADSGGVVYVADATNNRVQRFDPSAPEGSQFLSPIVGQENNPFDAPHDVAIHPITGEVFVADTGNDGAAEPRGYSQLQVFSADGAFQQTSNAYVNNLFDSIRGIAFDADGTLYAVDSSADQIYIFETRASELDQLPGDFNGDRVVDAADYTVWRDHQNQDEAVLGGRGDGSGVVDEGDITLWRANFSIDLREGSSDSLAVPEPAAAALLLGYLLAAFRLRSATDRVF